MALREPVLLLSRGFLFTRTTMARLDLEGGFAWLARLAQLRSDCDPTIGSRRTARNARPLRPRPPVAAGRAPLRRRRRRAAAADPRRPARAAEPVRAASGSARHGAVRLRRHRGRRAAGRRPHTTPERRRLVRRNRSAEQAAIDRLHQLGFRYTWSHFESRQILGISPEQFPKRRAHARERGLAGRGGRAGVPVRRSACSSRCRRGSTGSSCTATSISATAGRRRCRSCSRRSRAAKTSSSLDDGSVGLLPEEWLRRYAAIAGFGERRGRRDPLRAIAGGAARCAAGGAAGDRVRRDVRAASRSELQTFGGIDAADPPPSFRGHAARLSARGARLVRVPAPLRLRRLPRRRHGARQDGHGAGAARRLRATAAAGRTRAVARRRAAIARLQLDAGGGAVRAGAEVLDYTGAERDRRVRFGDARPRADDLRHAAARRRWRCTDVEFDYAILDEAQAIKNAATASAKAARLLRGAASAGAERHADREPSRRAVEPVRVPQSRAARHGARFSAARRRAARGDREALDVLARALRPFILRRTKEQVAPELPRRTEQTLQCELERRAAAALRRAARALPRDAARARRARRASTVEDADPRGAAAAAPGGVPSRAHRSARARTSRRRSSTSLIPRLAEVRRGGPQGARVLAVHEPARAPAPAARRARASPTSISTAARAIARRGSSGSRPIRPAGCS